MTISPLGDTAVVITLGDTVDPSTAARVRALAAEIERHRPAGVVDIVPAFASVAVFLDTSRDPATLRAELEVLFARSETTVVSTPARLVEIPVCYGGEYGPDLSEVAAHAKLSADQVVQRHAGGEYLVHAIGFAPGFPYLGGLPSALATPRRQTPRARVAAGSVGIGGAQTGIYPLETPGGWNLIGRTPRRLFDATRPEPALLRTGDRVKFHAISPEAFALAATATSAVAAPSDVAAPIKARIPAPLAPDTSEHLTTSAAAPIEILRPGLFTTIQDLGRRGHRAEGVPLSGAADPFALRLANLLVGNSEHAAALEFTLVGPEIRFHHEVVVALCGADFVALPRWRPLRLAAGTRLDFSAARSGCRGYLAIAGGIDVPVVLDSRSTYTRAGLGGFHGRALAAGDRLPVSASLREIRDHWRIDPRILPHYSGAATVRFVPGAQSAEFDADWRDMKFSVSSHSDRMGVRLTGGAIARRETRDLVSSPVAPGTIQVPPDGQPIVLLADAQTIGGYPKIGHVISVDLPLIAQLRPGDTVQFQPVSLETAHDLAATQERTLALLREGLAQKLA